jgi:hypothetical protein
MCAAHATSAALAAEVTAPATVHAIVLRIWLLVAIGLRSTGAKLAPPSD